MNDKEQIKPPTWFWIVAVIGLLWNIIGVFQYLSQAFINEETKALMSADELNFIEQTPAWINVAFAIAVWFGLIGCIALLMKKKRAKSFLLISLIAVIIQMSYSIFATNAMELFGVISVIMPTIVILVAILLFFFSKKAVANNWLT